MARKKQKLPLSVPVIKAPPAPKERYPLLDELALIQALSTEISVDTNEKIRGGAVLSIVDAFDRRIPRQMFLSMLSSSLMLYDFLGCLETVQRIETLVEKQKFNASTLTDAAGEYSSRSESARLYLLALMKGVVDCAPSGATIH